MGMSAVQLGLFPGSHCLEASSSFKASAFGTDFFFFLNSNLPLPN